jgi:hypothetical protein
MLPGVIPTCHRGREVAYHSSYINLKFILYYICRICFSLTAGLVSHNGTSSVKSRYGGAQVVVVTRQKWDGGRGHRRSSDRKEERKRIKNDYPENDESVNVLGCGVAK